MCGVTRDVRSTSPTRATRGRRPPPFLVAPLTGLPRSIQARLAFLARRRLPGHPVRLLDQNETGEIRIFLFALAGARGIWRSTERRPTEATVGSPERYRTRAPPGAHPPSR